MLKKIVFLSFLSISVLAGCGDDNEQNSTDKKVPSEGVEQNVSSSSNDKINLNDFLEIKSSALNDSGNGEYKLSDTKLENAEVILTEPLNLEKNENVTIEFQLESNDSTNNITIGIINNYKPDGPNEIEKIHSEIVDDKLKITYTPQVDSECVFCIIGSMADTVLIKNGKITKL